MKRRTMLENAKWEETQIIRNLMNPTIHSSNKEATE